MPESLLSILLDQNVPFAAAAWLRSQKPGWDVYHVWESGSRGRERRTSNIEHRTSNVDIGEHGSGLRERTSNIEHRTPNVGIGEHTPHG